VQPLARLDVSHLGIAASMLFEAGLAETTRRIYRTGAQRYLRFCLRAGRTPYPVKEDIIVSFLARLYVVLCR